MSHEACHLISFTIFADAAQSLAPVSYTHLNSTSRENAIRYGSSLRVKEGEVAVFVYKQKGNGVMQYFIVGPYDDCLLYTSRCV